MKISRHTGSLKSHRQRRLSGKFLAACTQTALTVPSIWRPQNVSGNSIKVKLNPPTHPVNKESANNSELSLRMGQARCVLAGHGWQDMDGRTRMAGPEWQDTDSRIWTAGHGWQDMGGRTWIVGHGLLDTDCRTRIAGHGHEYELQDTDQDRVTDMDGRTWMAGMVGRTWMAGQGRQGMKGRTWLAGHGLQDMDCWIRIAGHGHKHGLQETDHRTGIQTRIAGHGLQDMDCRIWIAGQGHGHGLQDTG